MFRKEYAEVFEGTAEWKAIDVVGSDTYDWQDDSTYIRLSPFFDEMLAEPAPLKDIHGARIPAMLGDSVTTDHISGWEHQGGQSGRSVSAKPWRGTSRFQLLRFAPW